MTPPDPPLAVFGAGHRDVDFQPGGVLRVRLLGAGPGDIAAVARWLGRPGPVATAPADITVGYTDRLPVAGLTYLGRNAYAYDDTGLYVLGRRTGRPKARLPLTAIGRQPELQCQRGVGEVPFLVDIVNLTFLTRDHVPLHASAFRHDGRGVLVTGWTKGGKTETLLAFADRGATYVGDEWVVLSDDGRCIFGLPVPVTLWDWQLDELTRLRPRLGIGGRLPFTAVRAVTAVHHRLHDTRLRRTTPFRLLDKALPAIQNQSKVRLAPDDFFPDAKPGVPVALDFVVLALSHADRATTVTPARSADIAARMAHSNAVEQTPFFDLYRAWLYAFPDRRNPFLDSAPARQAERLSAALADRPALVLRHPYPVPLATLYETLAPHLAAGGKTP